MNFLTIWKESLVILQWPNLKLFLLVTLKTFINAIKLIAIYFWWLVVTFFAIFIISTNKPLVLAATVIIFPFLSLIIYLSVRPSMEPKNFFYFVKYSPSILGFIILRYLFISLLMIPIFLLISPKMLMKSALALVLYKIAYILASFVCATAVFFYLDSQGWSDLWDSFVRGAKMVFFHLPIFLFLALILYPFSGYVNPTSSISRILYFFFTVFNASLFANYYTKAKHSHYKLFFDK